MRIIRIYIKNFRAFYNHHTIEFAKTGQKGKINLLVYGENGIRTQIGYNEPIYYEKIKECD